MQNGNENLVFENAEKAVKQMAACGLAHSAKAVQELLRYTQAVDKNQKALIRLVLKQERLLKKLYKYVEVSSKVITRKEERKILKMLKAKDAL